MNYGATSWPIRKGGEHGGGGPRRRGADSIGLEFGKLPLKVEVIQGRRHVPFNGASVAFDAIRRTFRTIDGETGYAQAVDRIVGHEDAEKMATASQEWVEGDREANPRPRRVTDNVCGLLKNGQMPDNSAD